MSAAGRGVRRGREEVVDGGGTLEGGRPAKRHAGEVLAGLGVEGPVWRLRADGGGRDEIRRVGEAMLEQALGCSELADVRFVFDDGLSGVGGHKAWMSSVSEVFAGMFRTGMEESKTGKVRVLGVSRESFRAFLEYVYLRRCGMRVCAADGRELWVLADVYQVGGLKEWLVEEGVWSMDTACRAMQYAKSSEGSFGELEEACAKRASWDLSGATVEGLRGVGVEAAAALLGAHNGNTQLWRGCDVLEGFKFVERWVRGNGGTEGAGAAGAERLVGSLDLKKLPMHVLSRVVRPSGLVSGERLFDLSERINEQLLKVLSPAELTFTLAGSIKTGITKCTSYIAVDAAGTDQLLAVVDRNENSVHIYKVEGGEHLLTIGPKVEGLGSWGQPRGVCFNALGEMLVSDSLQGRIHSFARDGKYLRSIGKKGFKEGELWSPDHLAVSPQGHIIVCDTGNRRVQVLREDGTFVRAFGREGLGEGQQLDQPYAVAVGDDGSIVAVDNRRCRVVVFDREGAFVRAFGAKGRGAGQFERLGDVCILQGGQILVSDWGRGTIQVFSWEGEYLRTISEEGDSKIDLGLPYGIASDSQGRVFVASLGTRPVRILSRALLPVPRMQA